MPELIEPSYLSLYETGELENREKRLKEILKSCEICPRRCKVNRLKNEKGFCQAGKNIAFSLAQPHFGEEPILTGENGSGTIFFTYCSLCCVYCQNYEISQLGQGKEITPRELAKIMINLQNKRVHNINLVSPTHFVPQIIQALILAIPRGFHLPLVYNTSGYERVEILKLLRGIIDIYLSDMRYSDDKMAEKYSGVSNYVHYNRLAIKEMFNQVGNPILSNQDVIQRGLIIRHLVLPNDIAGSKNTFRFLAEKVSQGVYVSLMAQYFPCFKAKKYPLINRPITHNEYQNVLDSFHKEGLRNGLKQDLSSAHKEFVPKFNQ